MPSAFRDSLATRKGSSGTQKQRWHRPAQCKADVERQDGIEIIRRPGAEFCYMRRMYAVLVYIVPALRRRTAHLTIGVLIDWLID